MNELFLYDDIVLKELADKGRSQTENLKNKITFEKRDHLVCMRENIMSEIIERALKLNYATSDISKIRLYVFDKTT